MTMATRALYTILVTGAVNSEESAKVREAGWSWNSRERCRLCGQGPAYLHSGVCLRCRAELESRTHADWASDEQLSVDI